MGRRPLQPGDVAIGPDGQSFVVRGVYPAGSWTPWIELDAVSEWIDGDTYRPTGFVTLVFMGGLEPRYTVVHRMRPARPVRL